MAHRSLSYDNEQTPLHTWFEGWCIWGKTAIESRCATYLRHKLRNYPMQGRSFVARLVCTRAKAFEIVHCEGNDVISTLDNQPSEWLATHYQL